jgi:hypothetical protein
MDEELIFPIHKKLISPMSKCDVAADEKAEG